MSKHDLFEKISGLDRVVHEPSRLAVLTALSCCKEADFLFLQRVTALSKGNLSSHLTKLEKAELVEIRKTYEGKKPLTLVSLTEKGRQSIQNHWELLDDLRRSSEDWKPEEE